VRVLLDTALPWKARVERTAEVAARDFESLRSRFDFMSEGRKAFAPYLSELEAEGLDPADSMCFVWYVLAETEETAKDL
jgi:hypothetical protein